MVQTETEFRLDDTVGRLQDRRASSPMTWAKGSDRVADILDTLRDLTVDQPVLALAMAAGAGILTGRWLKH